jgi:uncharacterized membrane protein YoaT (DUF817 family)
MVMLETAALGLAQRIEATRLPLRRSVAELAAFAVHNALACIFPVIIFAGLAVLRGVPHRYDAMLVLCIGVQVWMVRAGLESKDEAKVITLFHLLGLAMEIHKVRIGAWAYPDHAWTKVSGVPLYSGFMYASVASFMCQAWRRLRLGFEAWPTRGTALVVAGLLYLNFMTNHYVADLRWPLVLVTFVVFRKTRVHFDAHRATRTMPLMATFFLIALFVWLGEQIGTYLGAWRYPSQMHGWHPVDLGKLSSWFCLVIVSLVFVGELKRARDGFRRAPERVGRDRGYACAA